MTRRAIFEIRTDTWPRGRSGLSRMVDHIVDTIDGCSFPWERCIPDLRRRVPLRWPDGRLPFPITFDPGSRNVSGLDGFVSLRRMWLRPGVGVRTIAHEFAHVADVFSMSPDTRDVLAAQAEHHDDGRDHPHGWKAGLAGIDAWGDQLSEAFTVPWTQTFFDDDRFHYPAWRFTHRWDDPAEVARLMLDEEVDVFDDIADTPHRDAVEWAARLGLVSGYEDGTFRPSEPVTRGQLMSVLYAYHTGVTGDQ